ncbi:thiopeptide-type bacteriocin biosynthesis protein [Nocardia sp. NPDC046473]|uniref:thiopeptide-type bacteriocin biosynthesis protein n=1 Tax=Nocardia sp. NPDC046473 TaxID=3155733 RepID=UPI0034037FAD
MPWPQLASAVETWRGEDRFELCFFVRKWPGLRLRFAGPDLDQTLTPVLSDWTAAAEGDGHIAGYWPAVYEPEQHRFGGPAAMAIAHRQWDRDSRLLLAYETLPAAMTLDRYSFWAAAVNNLLELSLDDAAEVWDVWSRLGDLVSQAEPSALDVVPNPITPDLARHLSRISPELIASLDPGERRILQQVTVNNRLTADALTAVERRGELTVGKRSWLTAAANFQCNRWGLGLHIPALRGMITTMIDLLRPDQ